MAPSATIRPFSKERDDKVAHFMVAKASMESLAAANRRAYYHPIILSIWVGISCAFIEYMQWWPNPQLSPLTYLSPLPAFASVFVPIMFLIDWLNRPYFEKLTQDVLRAPDMRDIQEYYSRSPASGFWIIDYDNRFVGLIAIDASIEDTSSNNRKATTSETATIRHFYVQEPYPAAGIQDDLLSHAIIKAPDSPLVPYARKSLKEAGFLGIRSLQRAVWENRKKADNTCN
ncbi:hypothetical protein B0H17DRAFT_1035808 [Mycena rosella]|uniref:N-acetyltransferase domain-containing protein n=1 Tax=Mycena rosella TaxID=1033263 RepID=A0AAD7GVM9_MYCRO|nr:hypothetical protein B0H17DRAFT_1035808 [Mycena rosella]